MPAPSPEDAVADARATFDRGDRRAAWDSLRTRARRSPDERVYRRALVETYRAAGHPDQAARWGASMPELLTAHERTLLVRAVRRAEDEHALRAFLALPSVPAELLAFLPSAREQRRRRSERWAEEVGLAARVLATIGGIGVGLLVVVTLVQAFVGGRAHEFAQVTAVAALFVAVGVGTLLVVVASLRGRRVVAGLVLVAVVAAVVALAHADMTTTLPFG